MTEQQIVTTPVGRLAVRVRGEGPTAVLWHSLFVDERSWERVEGEFAAVRRLVVITGPGHGASSDPGRRYTTEDCADAARAVLDVLGVSGPVDWVGNAWGGHVGIIFAAKWPSRCRTLVTMGTPVEALDARARGETLLLLLAYRLLGPARFIQDAVVDTMLSPKTRAQDPTAVRMLRDCFVNADRANLRNAVVSISLRRPDLSRLLPRIDAPTLFITGADHTGWTPQQAGAFSELLPNGSSAVVADAAYLAPYETPEESIRLTRDFWATKTTGA